MRPTSLIFFTVSLSALVATESLARRVARKPTRSVESSPEARYFDRGMKDFLNGVRNHERVPTIAFEFVWAGLNCENRQALVRNDQKFEEKNIPAIRKGVHPGKRRRPLAGDLFEVPQIDEDQEMLDQQDQSETPRVRTWKERYDSYGLGEPMKKRQRPEREWKKRQRHYEEQQEIDMMMVD